MDLWFEPLLYSVCAGFSQHIERWEKISIMASTGWRRQQWEAAKGIKPDSLHMGSKWARAHQPSLWLRHMGKENPCRDGVLHGKEALEKAKSRKLQVGYGYGGLADQSKGGAKGTIAGMWRGERFPGGMQSSMGRSLWVEQCPRKGESWLSREK